MAALTPVNRTIALANALIAIAQDLQALESSIADIVAINNVTPLGNQFVNLNTTALLADGSLGTADASPVQTDPIDTRVYPTLKVALSYLQLTQLLTMAISTGNFLNGQAVSANGTIPALLAAVAANP